MWIALVLGMFLGASSVIIFSVVFRMIRDGRK